ncbi:hypothetical protein K435DRAFT_793016 [Dendrothele bispora CBS 962.96]|uniref:Uncharacterized protein n=1 Tax=Dendrothele bispora (strain CBS 962.96) TaxID=1314807 RepID=A0A4S8MGJ7_DENBC|nr:hypothetical protein K435DRAFT_793016 [Dendrothele bispora CBS 962.96]
MAAKVLVPVRTYSQDEKSGIRASNEKKTLQIECIYQGTQTGHRMIQRWGEGHVVGGPDQDVAKVTKTSGDVGKCWISCVKASFATHIEQDTGGNTAPAKKDCETELYVTEKVMVSRGLYGTALTPGVGRLGGCLDMLFEYAYLMGARDPGFALHA